MLTIFSCPKPFKNKIAILQKNAVLSWTQLRSESSKPEIILVGDDEGVKDVCNALGLKHLPNVKKNNMGVPLLSSIFSETEKIASYDLLCFINTDIILLPDFCDVLRGIISKLSDKFLLTGQRIDTDIDYPLSFEKNWDSEIKNKIKIGIKIGNYKYWGPDYFVFRKGTYKNIPSFSIGRYFWDNWLIYQAVKMKIPVIDLTSVIFALHQKHETHTFSERDYILDTLLENEEIRYNFKISGFSVAYDVNDFTYKFTDGKIIKNKLSISRFLNRLLKYLKYKFFYLAGEYKFLKPIAKLLLVIRNKLKNKKWI